MPTETAADLLRWARGTLNAEGIETASLDSRLLLQEASGLTHESLIAEPQQLIPCAASARFREWLERRRSHEPVSRILGRREFYGRDFSLSPAVLDPRPDTETLIAAVLKLAAPGCKILDLGTGSGIIAITLALEVPGAIVAASDVSAEALAVARQNAGLHLPIAEIEDRLQFIQSNWFSNLQGQFDFVLSNPPYIPSAAIETLAPEVRNHDPYGALSGGGDGLAAYRAIAQAAGPHLAESGWIIVEIGAGQEVQVGRTFEAAGFAEGLRARDLGGHVRCLGFQRLSGIAAK